MRVCRVCSPPRGVGELRGAQQPLLCPCHLTCPAVPATTILAVYLQSAIFCTPRRGSSL